MHFQEGEGAGPPPPTLQGTTRRALLLLEEVAHPCPDRLPPPFPSSPLPASMVNPPSPLCQASPFSPACQPSPRPTLPASRGRCAARLPASY